MSNSPRFFTYLSRFLIASSVSLIAQMAHADGLTDLKAALAKLQGQSNLKAQLEIKSTDRKSEGKKMHDVVGQANLGLESNQFGFHLSYSKETIAQMDQEERNKEADPKKKTPTIKAISSISNSSLRQMISASGQLSRSVDNAIFKSEKVDNYNGKPARLLSFDLSIEKLDPSEREAIKKYEGTLEVWIAADGTPLASKMRHQKSIRAMLVISFEEKTEIEQVYGVAGDHLLIVHKESRQHGEGMGEKGDMSTVTKLQVLS